MPRKFLSYSTKPLIHELKHKEQLHFLAKDCTVKVIHEFFFLFVHKTHFFFKVLKGDAEIFGMKLPLQTEHRLNKNSQVCVPMFLFSFTFLSHAKFIFQEFSDTSLCCEIHSWKGCSVQLNGEFDKHDCEYKNSNFEYHNCINKIFEDITKKRKEAKENGEKYWGPKILVLGPQDAGY